VLHPAGFDQNIRLLAIDLDRGPVVHGCRFATGPQDGYF
jgi:hypothetical protein